MAMLVYGSLHTTPPGEAGAFSLDGYRAMLSRANALVLLNTIGLSLVRTGLSMALALFLAWIMARTDTDGVDHAARRAKAQEVSPPGHRVSRRACPWLHRGWLFADQGQ